MNLEFIESRQQSLTTVSDHHDSRHVSVFASIVFDFVSLGVHRSAFFEENS